MEEKTVTFKEKVDKEFIYIGAYDVIRRLYLSGGYDRKLLERLNDKCADDIGCEPISLDAT